MKKVILDTSILLRSWNTRRSAHRRGVLTTSVAEEWGKQLVQFYESDAITTAILIEILGGTTSAAELSLMRAFLRPFRCLDQQKVTAHDWREAIRLSSRVPRDRRTRQLGDCLIRAIAKRLHYDVVTHDEGFPG